MKVRSVATFLTRLKGKGALKQRSRMDDKTHTRKPEKERTTAEEQATNGRNKWDGRSLSELSPTELAEVFNLWISRVYDDIIKNDDPDENAHSTVNSQGVIPSLGAPDDDVECDGDARRDAEDGE